MNIEQEKDYVAIVESSEAPLTFGIKVKDGEPLNPTLIYDGGEHAILYRNPEQAILLDYLAKEAKTELNSTPRVLIMEMGGEKMNEPVNLYTAEVKKVPMLPLKDDDFISFEAFLGEMDKMEESLSSKV